MKLFCAVILLIAGFFVSAASGQSKKDLRKNKVRSYHETFTSIENGKEATVSVLKQKLDANGNIIEEIDYDKEGKVKTHWSAVYDKNNDKTEETVFSTDGKVKKKKFFKYNAKGDRTEEIHKDASGKITEKVAFTYNANGERVSEISTDASTNAVTKKVTYTYDKKGMVLQERTVDGAGKLIKETRYTYEY